MVAGTPGEAPTDGYTQRDIWQKGAGSGRRPRERLGAAPAPWFLCLGGRGTLDCHPGTREVYRRYMPGPSRSVTGSLAGRPRGFCGPLSGPASGVPGQRWAPAAPRDGVPCPQVSDATGHQRQLQVALPAVPAGTCDHRLTEQSTDAAAKPVQVPWPPHRSCPASAVSTVTGIFGETRPSPGIASSTSLD